MVEEEGRSCLLLSVWFAFPEVLTCEVSCKNRLKEWTVGDMVKLESVVDAFIAASSAPTWGCGVKSSSCTYRDDTQI